MLVAAGLLIGLPCAYMASRYLPSELFGVTPPMCDLGRVHRRSGRNRRNFRIGPSAPRQRHRSHPDLTLRVNLRRLFQMSLNTTPLTGSG